MSNRKLPFLSSSGTFSVLFLGDYRETAHEQRGSSEITPELFSSLDMQTKTTFPAFWQPLLRACQQVFETNDRTFDLGDVEFYDEDACELEQGQLGFFQGLIFASFESGRFCLDEGVDCSDPSVGIFSSFEPKGQPVPFDDIYQVAQKILEMYVQIENDVRAEYETELAMWEDDSYE